MYRTLVFFAFLFSFYCFSQERKVFGYVKDSDGSAVVNVSVIFKTDGDKSIYLHTNTNGYFELVLVKNKKYTIDVYPFNHDKISKEISEDFFGEITIEISSRITNIEEVKIKKRITYKEDTVVYNIPGFSNGTERKLKDIVKKLPGFEVTKEGGVKVNGESVGTTLVEGQPFFNGNTKLALENIPADALEDLEVISNYNENQINKSTGGETVTAINLKLKDDKKSLIFGDATLGGGFDKNYYSHINAFQFKKTNSFSVIGDANNIGEQSFTFNDFLTMKGGAKAILGDANTMFSDNDINLLRLTLPVENYSSFNNNFITLNHQKSTKNKRWNSLVLFSDTRGEVKRSLERNSIDGTYKEKTETNNHSNRKYINGNFDFIYKPSSSLYVKNTIVTNVNLDDLVSMKNSTINSKLFQNTNIDDATTYDFGNQFTLDKIVNSKITYSLVSKLNWSQNSVDEHFSSETPFLYESLLEYQNNLYSLDLRYKKNTFLGTLSNGVSYRIDAKNRLNVSLDLFFLNEKINNYTNREKDKDQSFFNDSFYQSLRTNTKLEYFYKNKKFQLKTGVVLVNNYFKFDENLNTSLPSFHNFYALPFFESKYEWNTLHKIQLNYSLQNTFYGLYNFLDGFVVNDFNSVYKGTHLEKNNRLRHSWTLKYNRYNGLHKLGYNVSVNYGLSKGVVSTLKTDGAMRTTSVLYHNRFLDNFTFSGGLDKEFYKIKFSGAIDYTFSNSVQFINSSFGISQKQNEVNYSLGAMTRWKAPVNIDVNTIWNVNHFSSEAGESFRFSNMINSFDVDAKLGDFQLVVGLKRIEISKISEGKEVFHQGRINLLYSKESSPYEFGVLATNLFNNKALIENTISDIFVSSSRQEVLPRMITFKVTYKL